MNKTVNSGEQTVVAPKTPKQTVWEVLDELTQGKDIIVDLEKVVKISKLPKPEVLAALRANSNEKYLLIIGRKGMTSRVYCHGEITKYKESHQVAHKAKRHYRKHRIVSSEPAQTVAAVNQPIVMPNVESFTLKIRIGNENQLVASLPVTLEVA